MKLLKYILSVVLFTTSLTLFADIDEAVTFEMEPVPSCTRPSSTVEFLAELDEQLGGLVIMNSSDFDSETNTVKPAALLNASIKLQGIIDVLVNRVCERSLERAYSDDKSAEHRLHCTLGGTAFLQVYSNALNEMKGQIACADKTTIRAFHGLYNHILEKVRLAVQEEIVLALIPYNTY